MIVRRLVVVLAVLALAAGCRSGPDPSLEALEAELRWWQDESYFMQDHMALLQAQLESCRRENCALRKELNGAPSTEAPPAAAPTRPREAPALPQIDIPGLTDPTGNGFDPGIPGQPDGDYDTPATPDVEPGTRTEPDLDLGPIRGGGGLGEPQGGLPGAAKSGVRTAQRPADQDGTAAAAEVDAQVVRVVLNRRLTGGRDFDGNQGDDGILVVVEPQNQAGQYVALPGRVSVVVLDPAKTGQAANVARWEFDAADTRTLLKKTLLGRGIYLELPWPSTPPENEKLNLYVRYHTPDGGKLEAQREIFVDIPGLASERWTPATEVADSRAADSGGDAAISVDPSPSETPSPARDDAAAEPGRFVEPPRTESTYDSSGAFRPPPDYDPNEPAPRWNGGQGPPEASGQHSVVVRRNSSAPDASANGAQPQQALRSRPWTPHR